MPKEYRFREGCSPLTRVPFPPRPHTGKYDKFFKTGVYSCVVCLEDLFSSDTKYDAGCGWPAFFDSIDRSKLNFTPDYKKGTTCRFYRVELLAHLCSIPITNRNFSNSTSYSNRGFMRKMWRPPWSHLRGRALTNWQPVLHQFGGNGLSNSR